MEMNTLYNSDNQYHSLMDQQEITSSNQTQQLLLEIRQFNKINYHICLKQNDDTIQDDLTTLMTNIQYEELLAKIFEVNIFQATYSVAILLNHNLIQHMDSYKCHSKTKYLAKIYIDFYLKSNQEQSKKIHEILATTSMLLAIKFNQSFSYPIDVCLANLESDCSVQELIDFEIKLLTTLNFNLYYVTPFDYLNMLRNYIPQDSESQIYNFIEAAFDLCSLDVRLIGFQCLHIFLGCLAAFVQDDAGVNIQMLLSHILSYSSIIPYISQIVKEQICQSDLMEDIQSNQIKESSI